MERPADRPPTYASTPEPGAAAAVWVGRFDAGHDRVQVGPHAHHALQLLYVEAGGGSHVVGDHSWQVEAGDVYLIPPALPHDLSGLDAGAHGWVVEFDAAAAGSSLLWRANPLLNPFLAAELDAAVARLQVTVSERDRWLARFASMAGELDGAEPGRGEALQAWLQLLIVDVARLAVDIPSAITASGDPMLADAFRIIDERYRESVTPGEVADALGFTTGHLTSHVRARTGRTLQDWILERQMAEARRLLATTQLTVQEVATRCGYDDAGYFSRRFRQHHGVAPGGWRDAAARPV